ncbi:hypothetical protein [Embleya sp. NBC_00896]|uniref:hypothetical protein n=1 Tax=Embleya sp. NBC_00896 TaxID=2975961 RepID=UPI00386605B4|nr:hypothetical protein OG928_00165 [Embleya sp. NBC_00896]
MGMMTWHQTGKAQRLRRFLASLALTVPLALGGVAGPAVAARSTPDELCAAQKAARESLEAQISQHNAQPHTFTLPNEQAAYAVYNAEADQLNGQRDAVAQQLLDCLLAMQKLADPGNGGAGLYAPSKGVIDELTKAIAGLPADWKAPAGPDSKGYWRVPKTDKARPLFDTLRKDNPPDVGDVKFQGAARPKVGDVDPAYPAGSQRVIGPSKNGAGPGVSADHIVPLAEIISMPGFTKLTPQNMYAITRAPINFQWLSYAANYSKSSRSAAAITGVDPAWAAQATQLEIQARQDLRDLIQQLLKTQLNGG